MFKKIAVALLASWFGFAAMATQAALGHHDQSGEAAYVAGAIGQD